MACCKKSTSYIVVLGCFGFFANTKYKNKSQNKNTHVLLEFLLEIHSLSPLGILAFPLLLHSEGVLLGLLPLKVLELPQAILLIFQKLSRLLLSKKPVMRKNLV